MKGTNTEANLKDLKEELDEEACPIDILLCVFDFLSGIMGLIAIYNMHVYLFIWWFIAWYAK